MGEIDAQPNNKGDENFKKKHDGSFVITSQKESKSQLK